MFQDGCGKDMNSNELTTATLEKGSANEEAKAPTIDLIPEYIIYLEKGYYNGVCVIIHSKKDEGVIRKEYQAEMYPSTDKYDTEDVRLDE